MEDVDTLASTIDVDHGDILFIHWPESPNEIIVTSSRVVYFTTDTSKS